MRVTTKIVVKCLVGIVALLVLASLTGQLIKLFAGRPNLFGLIPLFNLDTDGNIPTFFSALLLLFAAALLGIVGVLERRSAAPYATHWLILSAIFLYLSADEAARIHELMSRPTTVLIGGGSNGIFYRTWVIPAGIAVCLFALSFLRFWLRLPAPTRRLFALAAVLYVGAAEVLEVVGGYCAEHYGFDTLLYLALATLEESLEMLGIILFIRAILGYIETKYGPMQICFAPAEDQAGDNRVH